MGNGVMEEGSKEPQGNSDKKNIMDDVGNSTNDVHESL